MDASKSSPRSLPDTSAPAPSGKGLRSYLQHLAQRARTTRFGNREVQQAEKLDAIREAHNQKLQQVMAASAPPATTGTSCVETGMQGDWISNLLHQEITGVTPLLKAIDEGNDAFALILLKNGALANTTVQIPLKESDPNIAPLFKQASFTSQESMNKCITDFACHLFNKAPDNQIREIGANALTLAILRHADHTFIETLIAIAQTQDKFFLDRPDGDGRTALCMAAENNDPALIALLLAAGANPHTKNGKQASPLQLAASACHTSAMIALLKAVAEPDRKPGALLEICYEHKNAEAFVAYQALSSSHLKDVLKFFKKKSESVLRGTEQDLRHYLAMAKPLITDKQLARLAIRVANRPDSFSSLMAITAMMKEKFNDTQLKALRTAAAQSENPATFAYAADNDAMLGMLESENVYFDESMQNELNEELALALKAHCGTWVNKLFMFGARLDVSLDQSADYPTLAQLADLDDVKLLTAFIDEHALLEGEEKWAFIDKVPPYMNSLQKVHTVGGFTHLLDLSRGIMNRLDAAARYALLVKAAKLGSRDLIERLVREGAELNYQTRIYKDFQNHHHLTPISGAIEAGNSDMVRTLLELGVVPSAYDISHRHQCTASIAQALLQARATYLAEK